MTTVLAIVITIGAIGAITWFMLVGQGRILKSRTRQRLQPGERIVFESAANTSSTGLGVMFSFREGFVAVTDYRLLFGSWSWPPFWTSVTETPLMDVDKISVIRVFGLKQVRLSIRGKTLMLTPSGGPFKPFSNQRTEQFVSAMEAGSGRTSEINDLPAHIRKQVGPKS